MDPDRRDSSEPLPATAVATRRPVEPKISGLRALRAWRRDPIGLLRRLAALGDVVRLPLLGREAWLLVHPDAIRDVLVSGHRDFMKGPTMQAAKRVLGESLLTSEGDVHRARRRMIQPIFHAERIEAYGRIMVGRAEDAAGGWAGGQVLDVHQEMTRLTLGIVGDALFGADVDPHEARAVGEAMSTTLAAFPRVFSPLFPILIRLPLPSNRRVERARMLLDATIHRMISARRAAGGTGGDLLSLLLSAREEGRVGMTDAEVRAEAMTLFLAGHETTAVALTWTWYLLAEHPVVETRLHAELDEVLGGRPPTPSDVAQLPYTQAIVRESMRVYPPAWAIGRRTIADHPVDGHLIPAGSVVVVSPYLAHHDPRWWPEPDAFRPERWDEDDDSRPRLAYVPFGGGPRMCVGEPFAWMEALLVVATIAQGWRLRAVPGHRVELQPSVTLRTKGGLPMTAERRTG
jgi:cytochrome P450